MKLYTVPKGTKGLVLISPKYKHTFDNGGRVLDLDDGQRWFTTQELSFTETVTDPVRASRAGRHQSKLEQMAKVGYAIFEGESTDTHLYFLAVLYNDVEVA